jgi:uncharacterized membrane protein (DUF4010 family)
VTAEGQTSILAPAEAVAIGNCPTQSAPSRLFCWPVQQHWWWLRMSLQAGVVDGTTEVAALVVLSGGILAGTGYLVLASAIVAITTLLLVEKSWLHAMIARIDDAGLRAGVRFAVMAVVILPLLPDGPYGPLGGVRPRQLWLFVLLFSGLSFIGYVARRLVGSERGFPVSGLLGGFVSSTAVAFAFARISRQEREFAFPLSVGVVAACSVMNLRVLAATAILRPALALALIPYLVAPFLVGTIIILIGLKRREAKGSVQPPSNPLQVMSALQMAVLFQVVLFASMQFARTGEHLACYSRVLFLGSPMWMFSPSPWQRVLKDTSSGIV